MTERDVREVIAGFIEEKAQEVMQEWMADPRCPKAEHHQEECQSRCDAYCILVNTFGALARTIRGIKPIDHKELDKETP